MGPEIALLLAALGCPYFPRDMTGPTCTPTEQVQQCACSECFTWDAVEGAERYEIWRSVDGVNSWIKVGQLYRFFMVDDGTLVVRDRVWCPPKDYYFPAQGVTYLYSVKACKTLPDGSALCSTGLTSTTRYVRGPYLCGRTPC